MELVAFLTAVANSVNIYLRPFPKGSFRLSLAACWQMLIGY